MVGRRQVVGMWFTGALGRYYVTFSSGLHYARRPLLVYVPTCCAVVHGAPTRRDSQRDLGSRCTGAQVRLYLL